jgi:hypothetical protein
MNWLPRYAIFDTWQQRRFDETRWLLNETSRRRLINERKSQCLVAFDAVSSNRVMSSIDARRSKISNQL